uniref:Peptidase S1 domain-containing protein n=1 Tax=Capra hircus TaxID=9925 RepID=A0A452FT94_CAPHI
THRPPLPLVLLLLCCRAQAIIGSTESKPHSRPYMAYLEIVTSREKQVACGGFLIRRDFVLTAAHCAGRSVTVTLRAHNIKKKEDTWQRLEVIKQFPYPKYDPVVLHDIMLLKLEEKANLTLAMRTLPFPPHVTFIHPGRMCQVAGWGKTGVKEPASSSLQEVKLRLMEPRACSHFPAFDHNLQLCVGNPQTQNLETQGALFCVLGVAQGIVSYGLSNAKPPAVFTRISPYRPWIDEVLKEN